MEISIHELYRFLPKASQLDLDIFSPKLISGEADGLSSKPNQSRG
jgi:hypothetical protein